MKEKLRIVFLSLAFIFPVFIFGQIGINTTNPKAALDIKASNPSTPNNQDGILIPRVAVFPSTNPTADQNGMLLFLTNVSGTS